MKRIIGGRDSRADSYDRLVERHTGDCIRENYFPILDRVISLLPPILPGSNPRVLDIGIGTGLLTERMPTLMGLSRCSLSITSCLRRRRKPILRCTGC